MRAAPAAERAGGDVSDGEDDVVLSPVAATRRATDDEFTAFVATATPTLGRTAWLLCGDATRAEELVQQALVKTYLAWPRARNGDPVAYARRVLANARIDSWRRTRRETPLPEASMPEPSGANLAEVHAERDIVARALARLTARQRRVVVLRYFLDLSEQQVADDLGVSVGTVKTTSSRALHRLRELLETTNEQPSPRATGHGGPR